MNTNKKLNKIVSISTLILTIISILIIIYTLVRTISLDGRNHDNEFLYMVYLLINLLLCLPLFMDLIFIAYSFKLKIYHSKLSIANYIAASSLLIIEIIYFSIYFLSK